MPSTITPIPLVDQPSTDGRPIPSIRIPHPFIPGLQIQSSVLRADSMGIDDPNLPAHLLPGTCVTLCSVVPWTLESHQYPHKRLPRYRLDAAGKDPENGKDHPYRILQVFNTTTQILLVNESRDGHKFGPAPVYALGTTDNPGDLMQGYANDLIREWAGDHPIGNHQGKLGVGIIIGKHPWQRNNEPTDEEVTQLRKLMRGHHYGLIEMADQAWVSNDPKVKARTGSQEYRRALEFAVRDYNEKFERHPWYIQLGPDGTGAIGTCPVCFDPFNVNAFICGSCRYNLADYFTSRQIKCDPKEFPGVAREIEFMRKLQSAKGNTPKSETTTTQ